MIRIKIPGNYLLAHIELCGDGCCSEIIWENQHCTAGEEFEENMIDTEFMEKESYEEISN